MTFIKLREVESFLEKSSFLCQVYNNIEIVDIATIFKFRLKIFLIKKMKERFKI